MKNKGERFTAGYTFWLLFPLVLFPLVLFPAVVPCMAQSAIPVERHTKSDSGVLLQMEKGRMRVSVVTPSILHVTYTPTRQFSKYPKLAVVSKERPAARWRLTQSKDALHLVTSRLQVSINRKTGALAYRDSDGEMILSEPQGGSKVMTPATVQGENTYHATQEFDFAPQEGLYGLGQYQKNNHMKMAMMNYAGNHLNSLQMVNTNKNAVVPFLVSSKGYGLLWNNSSGSRFHDTFTEGFWSKVADQIDYYFVYGPKIPRVIAGYRDLTGQAPMYPKWAYGYIQSRDRYQSQKQVLDVVKEYRQRKIPLDVIVQDWRYWGNNPLKGEKWESEWGNVSVWNSLTFNRERYPSPEKMMDTLHHKYNTHLFISVWPSLGVNTDVFKAMDEQKLLFPEAPWPPNSGVRIPDAFNPKAQKLYWDFLNEGLFSKGVDGWWMDSTEPSGNPTNYVRKGATVHFNDHDYAFARYLNGYSLMASAGVYEQQRKATSQKRVFILTRSAFAGQQRNGAATWSGDTWASWRTFKRQIAAGLNFSLAGIPYWTADIGGYLVDRKRFSGGAKNEAYRHLFVRWFEFGAFCPLFREHGAYIPREMWKFGKPGSWSYEALVQTDELRYRLLPYIYSQAWQVTHHSSTLMRALVYDFQDDPKVKNVWNEFMFGPSMLVTPVTEPGVTSRDVYLPKGAGWTSFWSGQSFEGGQTINTPAPIDHIPLYVKSGSILPMGPVMQYATEKPRARLQLRVYPGADGHFTLYEDENDNYNYEKGVYATTRLDWDDEARTLTIEKRHGSFPGMVKRRTFDVVLVGEEQGVGRATAPAPDRTVTYDGSRTTVTF